MTGQPPRRKHSPAVYRRRRLVVLLAVLVVVGIVVWLLVAQPWRGAASEQSPTPQATKTQDAASALPVPTSEPQPSASSGADDQGDAASAVDSPTPSLSATPVAEPCIERDIDVVPLASKDSYGGDEKPAFSIRLTNNGETDCTLNVGTSAQVFTVTSGSDTWWRSTDCQSEPSDMIVLIEAGQTVESAAPLVWDRTRSAVGTCDDDTRPRAAGGGASYHLEVEIGGIPSTDTALFLLY